MGACFAENTRNPGTQPDHLAHQSKAATTAAIAGAAFTETEAQLHTTDGKGSDNATLTISTAVITAAAEIDARVQCAEGCGVHHCDRLATSITTGVAATWSLAAELRQDELSSIH